MTLPARNVVLLHGAGGSASDWDAVLALADDAGTALLVPESRGSTWDAIRGDFGPDVRSLDAALDRAGEAAERDPLHPGCVGCEHSAFSIDKTSKSNADSVLL